MAVALDDFPYHQAPVSMEFVASSDRNFYDRYYFNAHDRTGDIFVISGLGIYPNLGVVDAFVTVRIGDRQHTVRFSDAHDGNREPRVGPYRIEVVEPLRTLRIVSDSDAHGVGVDLTWNGMFPVVDEAPHQLRHDGRLILDAQRFAQVGTWSGEIRVEGRTITVDPEKWIGTRDRSWGIRPVGEPEPAGRSAAEADPHYGFWWTYLPFGFDDFTVVVIAQEDGAGIRSLSDAVRVWGPGSDRGRELLGWPEFRYTYRPGSRDVQQVEVSLRDVDGSPMTMVCESLGYVALNSGPGYGGDPDWGHGQWRGRNWAEGVVADMTDPEVLGRLPFGVVDHVGRAVLTEASGATHEGWGLLEHGTIGAHAPTGFTDFFTVA
ncbi:MAG TPA: hypothetical protein PLP95_07010 [Microthrixaceae bacterium]|nr:hypothetical protein [Microthrixaceae bacterium]HPB45587.1 hypothetical protein [Microthrixaceae bacterium]